MSLRLKIVALFAAALVLILGSMYWVSKGTLLESFLSLEKQFTERDLRGVQESLNNELSDLDTTATDWAPWDDTYRFVVDQNQDYIIHSLNASTLVNLNLNAFICLDSNGLIVYSRGINLATEEIEAVSDSLLQYIDANAEQFVFTDEKQSFTGIIRLPDGLVMIAAHPILTSLSEGPIRGTLILGRYLDRTFLDSYVDPNLQAQIMLVSDPALPGDVQEALSSLSISRPILAVPHHDDSISGYLLVEDIKSNPAAVIVTQSVEKIYPQGKVITQTIIGLILAISLLSVILMWVVLDHALIRRIVSVCSQMDGIGASRSFTSQVIATGKDEIASLATSFNQVLQVVQDSQEALKASEENFRSLVENLVDWVWETDAKNEFSYSSPRVQELIGYLPTEIIGKSLFDLMTEEDAVKAREVLLPDLEARKAFSLVDLKFTGTMGEQRIMEVSGSPVFSAQGEFTGYRGISRDVTEHWEIERALIDSEKKYHMLFNYIPDAVLIYDRQTLELLGWNQAVTRIYGYSETELQSMTPMSFYAPGDKEKAERELRSPDLDCPIETVHLNRHGRRMIVEILMDAIVYQGRDAWIALVRDISERKKTEDALRMERDIVQSIFASSPDAITIIDLEGTILDCNQALLDMFGRSRKEEVVGDSIYWSIFPSERGNASNNLVETVEQGLMRNVEFMCRRAGGVLFPTESSAGLLRDMDGNPSYVVIISKDITERKRAERIQNATYRISQAANTCESLDELFHSIYTILNELFPARNLFIALYDEEKDEIRFPFFVDEYDTPPVSRKPRKGLTEYILRTGKPLVVNPEDFETLIADGEVESIGAPSLDWLGVPLHTKDRTIGVLVTQTYDESRRLGQQEISILSFVSNQVAMAIDRKMVETARNESETRLRRITDNMLDLICETDPDGQILFASPSHYTLLGYTSEALLNKSILDILHPQDRDLFVKNIQVGLTEGADVRLELRFQHMDGRTLWMELMSNPLQDELGKTIGVVHGYRDISDRKKAEEALRVSEERYRNLVEYQGEGICILDPNDRFLFANPAAEKIFGSGPDGLTGHNLADFTDNNNEDVLRVQRNFREAGVEGTYELNIKRDQGDTRSLLLTSTPWMDGNGDYIGSFTIFRDISDRKRAEEKLQFLSMHDALTGLYNRAFFEEHLEDLEREKQYPVSVVFADLNGLKVVNDTLGHAVGDELLRQTAIMLRTAFRGDDIIARLGGDEFGVLIPGADATAADKAVIRLRDRISEANQAVGALQISLSVGVATAAQGESLHEIMNLADQRMYADKPRNRRG